MKADSLWTARRGGVSTTMPGSLVEPEETLGDTDIDGLDALYAARDTHRLPEWCRLAGAAVVVLVIALSAEYPLPWSGAQP